MVETEDGRFETSAAGNVGPIGFAQSTATFVNTYIGGPRPPETGGSGVPALYLFGAGLVCAGLLASGW